MTSSVCSPSAGGARRSMRVSDDLEEEDDAWEGIEEVEEEGEAVVAVEESIDRGDAAHSA